MVAPSKVHIYKANEIDLDDLARKALTILHKKPFVWQLEIAEAVLWGEDVIVDVGTGSGNTLCFALPLLKDDTDMVLVVSPLTALMVDQVRTAINPDRISLWLTHSLHWTGWTCSCGNYRCLCRDNGPCQHRCPIQGKTVLSPLGTKGHCTETQPRIYCQESFVRLLSHLRLQHHLPFGLLSYWRRSSVEYYEQYALTRPTVSACGVEVSVQTMPTLACCEDASPGMCLLL